MIMPELHKTLALDQVFLILFCWDVLELGQALENWLITSNIIKELFVFGDSVNLHVI